MVVAAILSPWLAVNWVLGPLDRAAKNRRYPIQFTLADFLCLFVQIQLLLAWPATLFQTTEDKSAFIGIAIGVVALTLLVWWTGVHTLSRAGIHNTLGRALTLTIGIPFGYAGSLAIPAIGLTTLAMLFDGQPLATSPRLSDGGTAVSCGGGDNPGRRRPGLPDPPHPGVRRRTAAICDDRVILPCPCPTRLWTSCFCWPSWSCAPYPHGLR